MTVPFASFRGRALEGSWGSLQRLLAKPRSHGVERIFARPQDLCDAVLALVQDILNLIYPTPSLTANSLQSIFGVFHQPLPSFLTRKRREKQSQAHANSEP